MRTNRPWLKECKFSVIFTPGLTGVKELEYYNFTKYWAGHTLCIVCRSGHEIVIVLEGVQRSFTKSLFRLEDFSYCERFKSLSMFTLEQSKEYKSTVP